MVISIASGKGGTGKTTVAVGMALTGGDVTLVDADVEEPNCQILLRGAEVAKRRVPVMIPEVVKEACSLCGACARACRFNALLVGSGGHLLFPELCHGCGACLLACARGALLEGTRGLGSITDFHVGRIRLREGRLDVGEVSGVPLVRELKRGAVETERVLVDCPPGTACGMVAAVMGSDFCLLTSEPTLFGRHDLSLALAVTKMLGLPTGIVLNKSGPGDELITGLCRERSAPILARIPHDRRLAEEYARGELAGYAAAYAGVFGRLWETIESGGWRDG